MGRFFCHSLWLAIVFLGLHARAQLDCATFPGGTQTGEDILVPISKSPSEKLQKNWAPSDLLRIPLSSVAPSANPVQRLRSFALEALSSMIYRAAQFGLRLRVQSSYRSFQTQCGVFNNAVSKWSNKLGPIEGPKVAQIMSAKPGHSEHQLGTTIDFASSDSQNPLNQNFGKTPEGKWLSKNAQKFGFALSYPPPYMVGEDNPWKYNEITGYAYEPWHWRFIGVEPAEEFYQLSHQQKLTLIEYLRSLREGYFPPPP